MCGFLAQPQEHTTVIGSALPGSQGRERLERCTLNWGERLAPQKFSKTKQEKKAGRISLLKMLGAEFILDTLTLGPQAFSKHFASRESAACY